MKREISVPFVQCVEDAGIRREVYFARHCCILQLFGYAASGRAAEFGREGLMAQVSALNRSPRRRDGHDDPFTRRVVYASYSAFRQVTFR
jgi:hypothetical protein